MKRIRFRRKQQTYQKPKDMYPVNAAVLRVADKVNLIDENKEFLGVMETSKALEIADERGFDLVCVSPKAQPPVAKLLDYGSFKYKQEKQMKKQKALHKQTDIKGMRLSLRIGKHDLDVKLKQIVKFIEKGHKVRVEVILKGRERQHAALVKELIDSFMADLEALTTFKLEQSLKRSGHKFEIIIAPVERSEKAGKSPKNDSPKEKPVENTEESPKDAKTEEEAT